MLDEEPAPRELTSAETDHVSGGVLPIAVLGAVITAAIIQNACGDNPSDSSDDEEQN